MSPSARSTRRKTLIESCLFTVNHFARIEVGTERVRLCYVVEMAGHQVRNSASTISGLQDDHAPQAMRRGPRFNLRSNTSGRK